MWSRPLPRMQRGFGGVEQAKPRNYLDAAEVCVAPDGSLYCSGASVGSLRGMADDDGSEYAGEVVPLPNSFSCVT